ncbi:uncharacterized protein MYCGRDRAFT_97791 [Zymoseptoria tritici IPO323]|uniref:Retrovirus-related Pol polyprotein from transposon TNT 1-94-like beta-barrel domain-containing protein n=1 Tax=Zymoseptoria tritici (strain CBS 115943 / IPO323) TaxID=336722 RepID=F9XRD9_ZYMTI|nr:uncharacterized protein MYCGRDRAFT_97791 [Zymoseptoria tritici IPO323]EGP82185.1 hypothetical protein MYCGRDRAFT_97791 [Zymoseptoria tritici IPO323]
MKVKPTKTPSDDPDAYEDRLKLCAWQEKEDPKKETAHYVVSQIQNPELSDSDDDDKAPSQSTPCDKYILDSGTTTHIINNMDTMTNTKRFHVPTSIGKGTVYTTHIGTVQIDLAHTGPTTLSDTLLIPDIVANLVSMEAVRSKGVHCDPRAYPDIVAAPTLPLIERCAIPLWSLP